MRKLFASLIAFFIGSIAHAAIISSATGTSFSSASNISSFTLNRPNAVNVGDLLFVQIVVGTNVSASAANGSGWTLLDDDNNSGTRQLLFYKVATSTDTANGATTWTLGSSTTVTASMTGYRSDLGGRSVVLGASMSTTGNSATMTAPAMTATAPGRLLRFYGHRTTSTLNSSTLTTHVNVAGSPVSLLAGSRAIAGAGTTTTDTVNASGSARFIIHSVLLTESTLTKPATCYSDTFSNSTTFGQNWVTTSVGTTTFNPTIVNNRLQLTSATNYISTAATLQRIFPTSNLIYVEFNYYSYPNDDGADGIAVTLSDASITPQAGGFGGSLGYAQRNDSGGISGFAGGWIGVALDEYGNFSNPTEGRNGGPGRRIDSVSIRGSGSGQTGYAYVAGTAANQNPEIDSSGNTPGPGHRYRIVIDAAATNQTYITVDRDTGGTGTNYVNLIPTLNIQSSSGQAAIPANLMLSFTGSTGASNNNHEIDNLSVCATTINTTTQVDHFEFTHDGQGLTCEPENITIRACANADCSTLMTVPVDVTLTSGLNWVGGNVQTITGSGVVQLRQTTAATAGFKITNSTPGTKPFTSNRCNGTAMTTSPPGDVCNLPFVNAGLAFDVPNLLANKPSGAVRLRAVKNSGDANNSCVALFQNSQQSINFWSAYSNPTTGTRPVELSATAGNNAFTNISGNSSSPTAMLLSFDNNGETTFEARYKDAGLMTLNAQFIAPNNSPFSGLVLTGTDNFVSTPAGFCVRGAKVATSPSYANCTTDFASCPVIATVLNPFVLDITAAAWETDNDPDFCVTNGSTPNYSQNSLLLSSQFGLTPAEFNAAGTANNGVVGRINNGTITSPATVNITAGSGGNVNIVNATESEVGAFEFMVTPPALAYFGVTVPPGKNRPVGRFIPHHLAVNSSTSNLINRTTSCNPQPIPAPAFNYMGERFDLIFSVVAQNAANQTTQNYQGVFAKLQSFPDLSLKAVSPVTSTLRTVFDSNASGTRLKLFDAINNPMLVSWANGIGSFTLPLTLTRSSTTDGAYISTAFGVAPKDSDDVITAGIVPPAFGALLPLNLDTKPTSNTSYDHAQIGSNTEFRYGRLRLDSASGPANLSLAIPITAEYWNGSGFITNPDDTNCTNIVINTTTVALGTYSGNLNSGETNFSNGGGFISSGKAPASLLQLSAPGNGNEGSVGVTLDTSPWPWLQFDWNGDGSSDSNVTATASFGTYRGSDRVIYWQETQ